ncbi:WG repeat-containing protein [uncultured Aquimarina sp.]|uniref:WG repeat-containing protein n=1 Tax=uncultured Aquimarina sp. TaxID=575652 RepID=UPI00261D61B1|nr:WG repeat-containing protein [uncultured Aquimarina sp.]
MPKFPFSKLLTFGFIFLALCNSYAQENQEIIPTKGYYIIDSLSHDIPKDIMKSINWSLPIDSLSKKSYYFLETDAAEVSYISAYTTQKKKKDRIDFQKLKILDDSDNALHLIDQSRFIIELTMNLSLTSSARYYIKLNLGKVSENDNKLRAIKAKIESLNNKKKKEQDKFTQDFLYEEKRTVDGYVTAIEVSDYGISIPLEYTSKYLRESGEKTSLYSLKKDSLLGGITLGKYKDHFYGHMNVGIITSKQPVTIADYIAVAPNYRQEVFFKDGDLILFKFFNEFRFIGVKKINDQTYAIAEAESQNKNIEELKEFYRIFNSVNSISEVKTLDLKSVFLQVAPFLQTDKEKELFKKIEKEVNNSLKDKMRPDHFVEKRLPKSFYLEEYNTYPVVFSITNVSIDKKLQEIIQSYPDASIIIQTNNSIVLQTKDKIYKPFVLRKYQGYTLLFQIKEDSFSKNVPLKLAVKFYQVIERLELGIYPLKKELKSYFNRFRSAYRDRIDSTYIFISDEGWDTKGVLSDKGKIILPTKYENIRSYKQGFLLTIDSLVNKENTETNKKKEYTGWANRKGEIVLKPKYESIYPMEETSFLKVKDSLYGLYDMNKKQYIIPPSYETISFHKEAQRIELKKKSKEYYMADYTGRITHNKPFTSIRVLGKQAPITFMATRNHKDFFIDHNGKKLDSNQYDMLYPHYKEKVVYYRIGSYGSVDKKDGYLDYQGNIVEEFSKTCKDIDRKIVTRPNEVFIADINGNRLHKRSFKSVFRIPEKRLFIVTENRKKFIVNDSGVPINKKKYDGLFPVIPEKRILYRIGKKGSSEVKEGYLDFDGNIMQ